MMTDEQQTKPLKKKVEFLLTGEVAYVLFHSPCSAWCCIMLSRPEGHLYVPLFLSPQQRGDHNGIIIKDGHDTAGTRVRYWCVSPLGLSRPRRRV